MNFLQEIMLNKLERAERLANSEKRRRLEGFKLERRGQRWQEMRRILQLFRQIGKIRIQISFGVNEPRPCECKVAN